MDDLHLPWRVMGKPLTLYSSTGVMVLNILAIRDFVE